MKCDVAIVGGGISGCAAAYELARAEISVTLIEKGTLASMASGWTLAGVRQSGRDPAEIPLAVAAVQRWQSLADELGSPTDYRQEGNLRLARNSDEVQIITDMVEQQRQLGLDLIFLPDNASVRELAPELSEDILAASYCPTDGHANPTATVHAFAKAAKSHGAKILTETSVTGIDVDGGRVRGVQTTVGPIQCDSVVIAAGVYSDRLCRMVGLDFPISVMRVAVIQSVPLPPLIRQVLGVANGDIAGRQEVDGRLRFTGYALPWAWPNEDLSPEAVHPTSQDIVEVIERVRAVLPAFRDAGISRVWGGLIDMTPDELPVIERCAEVEGLVIAAGFSGHGFCLGPITGQLIGDLVISGESSLSLDSFRRDRLMGNMSEEVARLHG